MSVDIGIVQYKLRITAAELPSQFTRSVLHAVVVES